MPLGLGVPLSLGGVPLGPGWYASYWNAFLFQMNRGNFLVSFSKHNGKDFKIPNCSWTFLSGKIKS